MNLLKDISIVWSMLCALAMLLILFESRYSLKKTLVITALTITPLIVLNLILMLTRSLDSFGVLMLASLSLPSCIVFWVLAKHRDGRFFFTFCMVDTLVLEILYATNILDYYVAADSDLAIFLVRLILYPLLVFWTYKKLRPMYLKVQQSIRRGWWLFAIIGLLFYIAITLMMAYPTLITQRPEQLPALLLMFLLMPAVYLHIIMTLRNQQAMYDRIQQEELLAVLVSNLRMRMEELNEANDRFRVERHNLRHRMKTVASLLKTEQYEECLKLLSEYEEALDKTRVKRYCQHPVLDAVFAAYLQRAERENIRVEIGLAFPDTLPIDESELATAIANALENAIDASGRVSPADRFLEIKVVSHPRLMIRIANRYEGPVEFDDNHIPVNRHRDHGIGTRFIAAFCRKNNGFYQFDANGTIFTLYLNF